MKLSAIIKSSICVLSLVGASNFLAVRANAGQASARAAVTITNPGSFTQSVSGEVLLPDGLYYVGTGTETLTVTPTVTVTGTTGLIDSLSFYAGEAAAVNDLTTGATLESAVVAILDGTNTNIPATSIDDAAAIIKAAVGVNGLE
jgi:hypothetical protein